jgi:hypothetical protein
MDKVKNEEKDLTEKNDDNVQAEEKRTLDGKRLYDLYRHTTKLIE